MSDYIVKAPDKSRSRTFIYKKDSKPMIVYSEEAEQYYSDGWHDSPAAFFDMEAHGVDKEKEAQLRTEIDDIKDMVNDDINLEAMNAKQLKEFAKKTYPGLQYQKNAKAPAMLQLIRETKAAIEKEEEEFLKDDEDVEVENL